MGLGSGGDFHSFKAGLSARQPSAGSSLAGSSPSLAHYQLCGFRRVNEVPLPRGLQLQTQGNGAAPGGCGGHGRGAAPRRLGQRQRCEVLPLDSVPGGRGSLQLNETLWT